MYSIRRDPGLVRDGGAPYGPGPSPSETFQAEGVLDDLVEVPADDVPLVLARYAALRAWLLRSEGAAPALVRHARSAAWEHLRATPPDWSERAPLEALLRARPAAGPARLEEAAGSAEAAGHAAGARALRRAAHRARWPVAAWPRPSRS